MAKKQRMPWDIEPSSLIGYKGANAEEIAETIMERFGPPEVDEEDHLYGTQLLGADINPLDEQWQKPKGDKRY